MHLAPPTEQLPVTYLSPWRDTVAVLIATALTIALSAHFNWNEALYALTRREERLQLDELPIGMLVLLTGLIWIAWRRNRQARQEIRARRVAETQLEEALAANRALAKETLRIQEADRKHLALELHDELGQYLNAIKLDAVSIRDGTTPRFAGSHRGLGRNRSHRRSPARCREPDDRAPKTRGTR